MKFLVVGACAAGIQFVSFSVLLQIIGAPLLLAFSISYLLSVLFHFFANRHFTFNVQQPMGAAQILWYATLVFLNYLISSAVFWACRMAYIEPHLALILSIGATTLIGFVVSRNWIFASKRTVS